jgi:hypothetical protein
MHMKENVSDPHRERVEPVDVLVLLTLGIAAVMTLGTAVIAVGNLLG